MSDGGPAVVAAASSSESIACIRRQFQLRIDAVHKPPIKLMAKPRPASFRDPKTVFAKPQPDDSRDRPDPIPPLTPKPGKATVFSRQTSMPCTDPTSSSSFSSSSSSSFSCTSSSPSQIHPKQQAVAAAAGTDQEAPQETDHMQLQDILESCDEISVDDFLGHSQVTEITKTLEFLPTDDIHESASECSQAEGNYKLKPECTSLTVVGIQTSDRSKETNNNQSSLDCQPDDLIMVSTPVSNLTEITGSNEAIKMATQDKHIPSVKRDQYCAEQRMLEETNNDSLNDISFSPSKTPPKKWTKVTRSLENLCSTSAGSPIKELDIFREKNPNDISPLTATAADADVVASSQSLDRSTSSENKPKSPAQAKKTPPPPVPKKYVKFSKAAKSCGAVDTEGNGDSNTNEKLSSEDGNSLIHSEATSAPEGAVRQRSMSSASAMQTKKAPRPKTLFPPTKPMTVSPAVEPNHDKYKSLPTLSHLNQIQTDKLCIRSNRKDTLFPCHRQKPRPQGPFQSSDLGAEPSPEFYSGRCIDESQPLLESPMSLGNRTPSDIEPLTANSEDRVAECQRSSCVSSDCTLIVPLQSPANSNMLHSAKVEPESGTPSPSSDDRILNADSDAEQQVSEINGSSETINADSFLDDAFDFLSCEEQPIKGGTIKSSLKLWTDDTWCQNGTKSHSETPLRASTAGSTVDDDRKGDKQSIRGDNIDQDRREKESQTARRTEEDRQRDTEHYQRTSEDKEDAIDNGSKTPEDPQTADVEQTKLFGVVLRQSSINSMRRRSANVSFTVSNNPITVVSSRSAATTAAADELDRRSSATVRTSSTPRSLSRLPSLPSLTILPTNRPITKTPGKYIGGKPSVILDGKSSIQMHKRTELETAIDSIEKAFEFLDDSGA